MRTHTKEAPYKCKEEGCDMSFKTAAQFNDHKSKAHNIGRKRCTLCDYVCDRNNSLLHHMRIHKEKLEINKTKNMETPLYS